MYIDYLTLKNWRVSHLADMVHATDAYYNKLSKRLYLFIQISDYGLDVGEEWCNLFASTLTCYFEDVVSGLGLWESFVTKHKELYGKYLPFYDDIDEEEYYPDDVNEADIRFLIWQTTQMLEEKRFINPENPYLCKLASELYEILYDEFEHAPINEEVTMFFNKKEIYNDFYKVKNVLQKLVLFSYLLSPHKHKKLDSIQSNIEGFLNNADEKQICYMSGSLLATVRKSGPLNLYVKEHLAYMLRRCNMQDEAKWVEEINGMILQPFVLEEISETSLLIKDKNGTIYHIDRDSFATLHNVHKKDTLIASLVNYRGEWYPNGMTSWSNGDLLFKEYCNDTNSIGGDKEMLDKLLAYNNGHRWLYLKNFKELHKLFDKLIGVSKDAEFPEELTEEENIAIYIGEKNGVSIMPNAAVFLKDSENPFYKKNIATDESFNSVVNSSIMTDEALHDAILNDMLPDAAISSLKGKARGRQLVQENIDFIARFMRNTNY